MKNKPVVIVTGASGFIGYRLCEYLASSYDVVGLDRPGGATPPSTVDQIDLDLSSRQSVEQAFEIVRQRYGNKIASVIHLAAYYDFSGKPSDRYEEITVRGTERLIDELQSFQVEQFVFSSSMLVHAPCQVGEHIDESWPFLPKWDYPKSKVKTENLIRRKKDRMPTSIARVAGVYNNHCHSIPLANQIQRIYEKTFTSHLFPGDLSHGQSFIHLEDLIVFFGLLIEKRRQLSPDTVFLAGEPTALSYQTLQSEFGKYIHDDIWKTFKIPKLFAKIGAWLQEHLPFMGDPFIKPWMIDLADDHYALDISHAQQQLGWVPRHSLRNTIPFMISALKKNPVEWYKENHLKAPAGLKRSEKKPPTQSPPPMPPGSSGGDLPVENRMKEMVEAGANLSPS